MSKFKAGDKIVFGRGKRNSTLEDVTIGKIYTVFLEDGVVVFCDDVGDYNYALGKLGIGKATKIIE